MPILMPHVLLDSLVEVSQVSGGGGLVRGEGGALAGPLAEGQPGAGPP